MLAKYALLLALGVLWSGRLTAIKLASESGIPVQVTSGLAVIGIAAALTGLSAARGRWPSLAPRRLGFYAISGGAGFLLPFLLELTVSPHLQVFVLIVVIATAPILTLLIGAATGTDRMGPRQAAAVGLGFLAAVLIAFDTTRGPQAAAVSPAWVAVAFLVPLCYAATTVFVAARMPRGMGAAAIAHGQALVMAAGIVAAAVATGSLGDWRLAAGNPQAVAAIVVCETLALILYLRIAREHGPVFVSLANYVSMAAGAGLGYLVFGDRLGGLSVAAALALAVGLRLSAGRGGAAPPWPVARRRGARRRPR